MADTFSTPPTSPLPPDPKIAPSLSRRISRPTSLHLGKSANSEWNPDIVLDDTSPVAKKSAHGNRTLEPPDMLRDNTVTPTSSVPSAPAPHLQRHVNQQPMHSPCFVHSHLDKGASLTDWLRTRQNGINESLSSAGSRSSLSSAGYSLSSSSSGTNSVIDSPDESDFSTSLTKQLAETAVGVREMSKQLG